MRIDPVYIQERLTELVKINSVNPAHQSDGPGEQEVAEYLAECLNFINQNRFNIEIEFDQLSDRRANVTGIIRGTGNGRSLMLNAHTDTVGTAGMEAPFAATINDGKLYGRGSYDMKASIAAILAVAKALNDHNISLSGDLYLSFVADEEYASIGARALVQKHKPDAAIVTEPTSLHPCLAHRGLGLFRIKTRGVTAHGGHQHIGVDANMHMARILAGLHEVGVALSHKPEHPLCGVSTLHIPLMEGGRSICIYAAHSEARVERRTLPHETPESVKQQIQSVIDRLEADDPAIRATLETDLWLPPYEISKDAYIVESLIASGSTVSGFNKSFIGHPWWEDSAIFGEAGIPTVIFGPHGGGIHQEVEWVELASVNTLAEVLLCTAIDFCREREGPTR